MRQFFKKIALIFFGISLGVIILETTVRFLPEPAPPRLLSLIEPDSYIGTIYKKNLDTYIEAEDDRRNTVPFRTNSFGFIGENWASEKREMRITNYGDSFTAGLAVPYEKNYVSTLGNVLSDRSGIKIESLNFGITGQGTKDALETYRYYGQQAGGDIVFLWMYLGNDFLDNFGNVTAPTYGAVTTDKSLTEKKVSLILKLLKKSELVFFIKDTVAQASWGHRVFSVLSKIPGMKQFIYKITLAEYPLPIPLDLLLMFTEHEKNGIALEETKKYVQEFSHMVAKNGGKFFVVLVPAHFQVDKSAELYLYKQYPELLSYGFDTLRPNRTVEEMLEGLSISHLDLTAAFIKAYNEGHSLYICRFCHFNEEGHRLAGETVAEWFYRNNVN